MKRFLFVISGLLLALVIFVGVSLEPIPFSLTQFGVPFTHNRYLIIFQNDAELRPTGGFITSYAVVDVDHGIPTDFTLNDVYFGIDKHKFVDPPYPLDELLGSEFYQGHSFRDANFEPDFPKTTEDLLGFYRMTNPDAKFDGVIAVNYSVLEDVLGVLGEVKIGDTELNERNVFESLEHNVSNIDRHNVEAIKGRKGILGDLAKKIIKKAIWRPWKYRTLAKLVRHELDTKNVMMWFANEENPYDGSFPTGWKGDFLAFNMANYGGMKTDRYIKRDVRYYLTIDRDNRGGGNKLKGNLEIDLLHIGGENIPLSGEYTGYTRVYLPKDTHLLETDDSYYFEENENYLIVGEIVKLSPGEGKTLHYTFELPRVIFDGENYALHLQKQSGTLDHYSVYVRSPNGANIVSEDFTTRENTASYDGTLDRDTRLELTILKDSFPPRLVFQDFSDPSVIVINFNEELPSSAATDPLNYKVNDLNMKRPEIDQQIVIAGVEHSGAGVFLHLKEPIDQEDEHFAIELKNIFDLSGNFIDPNPKLITVVQNFIK